MNNLKKINNNNNIIIINDIYILGVCCVRLEILATFPSWIYIATPST